VYTPSLQTRFRIGFSLRLRTVVDVSIDLYVQVENNVVTDVDFGVVDNVQTSHFSVTSPPLTIEMSVPI